MKHIKLFEEFNEGFWDFLKSDVVDFTRPDVDPSEKDKKKNKKGITEGPEKTNQKFISSERPNVMPAPQGRAYYGEEEEEEEEDNTRKTIRPRSKYHDREGNIRYRPNVKNI